MESKKKQILKKILGVVSGAKEAVSNFVAANKANKQSRENISQLAIIKAKKLYQQKTGREMTPSMLKSEFEGGIPGKDTQQYLKNKKNIYNEYKDKYKL
jgi:DNA polymerase III delta prime subunit